MTDFFTGGRPRLFAHRGASGTFPENTMASFEAAASVGATAFELDVHRSADGEIVVIHDETLERTTDGQGLVRDHDIEALQRLDAGFRFSPDGTDAFPFRGRDIRIPRLAEILETFPDFPLIIEIKQIDPPIEQDLARLLQSRDATERALVFSLHQEPIDRYRHLGRGQTGFGPDDVAEVLRRIGSSDWSDYSPPGVAFAVPTQWQGTQIISGPFIEAAHRIESDVYVWTVNEVQEMRALLDLGVDGLISDFPERVLQVFNSDGSQEDNSR